MLMPDVFTIRGKHSTTSCYQLVIGWQTAGKQKGGEPCRAQPATGGRPALASLNGDDSHE